MKIAIGKRTDNAEIEGVYSSALSINSFIQPRRTAKARKHYEKSTKRIELPAAGSKIRGAMADEVMKSVRDNAVIQTLLYKLIQTAIDLHRALGKDIRIHCFLSCDTV